MIYPDEYSALNAIKPTIHNWLDQAHGLRIHLTNKNQLPTDYGYYCIMSDKPTPKGARQMPSSTHTTHNNLYLWRDGVGQIRTRIGSSHLFRKQNKRRDGKAPNSMKITTAPISTFTNVGNTNYTPTGDGITAYENGIDIDEPQWDDYKFYVAFIKCQMLANVIEQEARNYIGMPITNLQGKK